MKRPTKVMIVEDHFIIAEDINYQLNAYGYEGIFPVFSGEEAIEKAKNEDIDIILMDIQLEGKMDGIQAANEISKYSNASIIFITGNSDNTTIKKVLDAQGVNLLIKPIETEELIRALDLALFQRSINLGLAEIIS
jgi:CheY-like chemotaxis protein